MKKMEEKNLLHPLLDKVAGPKNSSSKKMLATMVEMKMKKKTKS